MRWRCASAAISVKDVASIDYQHRHSVADGIIRARRAILAGDLDYDGSRVGLIWRIYLRAGVAETGQYSSPRSLRIGAGLVDLGFQNPSRTVLRKSRRVIDLTAE